MMPSESPRTKMTFGKPSKSIQDPSYSTPASGKLAMRRKTVEEFRRQALGSKNEKNFGSG